jgi:hypothetical protein
LTVNGGEPEEVRGPGEDRTAYTCKEYRQEMILLALRRKLLLVDLTEEERLRLTGEVARLERELGM